MSAYGKIAAPVAASNENLVPLLYRLPDGSKNLAVVPLKGNAMPDELVQHLAELFNGIVREGRTYPQENELSIQEFKDYFLAYDLFLGVLLPNELGETGLDKQELPLSFFSDLRTRVERAGSRWKDLCAGCYYVKPNYPGRSSHCCNAGFIVDSKHRGLKIGRTLGVSYLHYAPQLGYKFSVFNLVYVNNIASIKIWDSLGFQRVGLVPNAGRLKTVHGNGEEYVDAFVFWRNFAEP